MCVFLLYNLECTVSFTLLERGRKARGGEDVVMDWRFVPGLLQEGHRQ